jgi:hypothetical protein
MNLNRPGSGHDLIKEVMKSSRVIARLTKQQPVPEPTPVKPAVAPRSKFADR